LDVLGTATLNDVTVTALPSTKVLRISLSGSASRLVSERLSELAKAYLRARSDSARAQHMAEVRALGASQGDLKQQIVDLRAEEPIQQSDRAAMDVVVLRARLKAVSRQRSRLEASTGADVGRILRGPETTGPSWVNIAVAPTSGLTLGAFAGFAWSLAPRRRVLSGDDLRELTHSPVRTLGEGRESSAADHSLVHLATTKRQKLLLLPVNDQELPGHLVDWCVQRLSGLAVAHDLPSARGLSAAGPTAAADRARVVVAEPITSPAGAALAASADTAVLLVLVGTRQEHVRSALNTLRLMGTHLSGAVLLAPRARS
jgi:hypothetical protein